MTELPDALFFPDHSGSAGSLRFVPSELTRGPWSPDAQHGGPSAALLAGLIDAHEPSGTRIARVTYELLRPVPLTPLDVQIETIRPGRKVQIVQASLRSGDTEVVRATALRIRATELSIEDPDPQSPPPMGHAGEFSLAPGMVMFALAFDVRREREGMVGGGGPQVIWFRLRIPVVAGTELRPIERLAAAADFPNGISSVVPWESGWIYINPDLTVHMARVPEGEWIGLDARTVPSGEGVGMAEAELYDTKGRVGRSVQSILFDEPS